MYNRFYDSIINPRKLVDYRADSIVRVFMYIVLFALLLSTRTIIEVATFDGLDNATRTQVQDEIDIEDTSCQITNGELLCDSKTTQLIFSDIMFEYYLDSKDALDANAYEGGYNIVVHKESVYLIYGNSVLFDAKLNDLPEEAHNIDFGLIETDSDAFFDSLYNAVDSYLMSEKNVWGPILIVFDILTSFFMIMVFVLISAWMLRMRFKVIRFRHLFTMTAYSSTALYVILILNTLYSLSFFLILILIIVAFRQNNQLSMEIMRRLQKNNNKKS